MECGYCFFCFLFCLAQNQFLEPFWIALDSPWSLVDSPNNGLNFLKCQVVYILARIFRIATFLLSQFGQIVNNCSVCLCATSYYLWRQVCTVVLLVACWCWHLWTFVLMFGECLVSLPISTMYCAGVPQDNSKSVKAEHSNLMKP